MLALVVTVVTWLWTLLKRPESDRQALEGAAAALAVQVAREASTALQRALGESAAAQAADVAFRRPDPSHELDLVRWRTDGGAAEGALSEIGSYYESLTRGRLVILGDPGSGKTVLAYHLARALARKVNGHERDLGPQLRLPVWATLPSWDPGDEERLRTTTDQQLVAEFDRWLVARIVSYGTPEHLAQTLVSTNLIVPVLDGLDEMDVDVDGIGLGDEVDPVRAMAVIRVLNSYEDRALVITCRKEQYRRLAASRPAGGRAPVVQDAEQVIIEPLTGAQVADYVERRFHGGLAEGWLEVVRNLREQPDGHLARMLRTPWRMFLAITAFRDPGTHPERMIGQREGELAESLIGELVPAITEQHPRPGGGYYAPVKVTGWLMSLASELERGASRTFRTRVDIRVEELWRLGGVAAGRAVRILVGVLLGCVLALVTIARRDDATSWSYWLSAGLGIAGFILGAVMLSDTSLPFTRIDRLKLRQGAVRRKVAVRLTAGLLGTLILVGLAALLARWFDWSWLVPQNDQSTWQTNVLWTVLIGLFYGGFWAMEAVTSPAAALRRPSDVLRQAAVRDLVLSVAMPPFLLAVILASDWPRYFVGTYLAYRTGRLPWRPVKFLDWAYEAGLLRLSGGAIQFRHRELQDWLARRGG